jgi:hypothetical protein
MHDKLTQGHLYLIMLRKMYDDKYNICQCLFILPQKQRRLYNAIHKLFIYFSFRKQ